MTTETKLKKTLLIGNNLDGDVWIEVKYEDGRLSITGVVGPMRNGNAKGSAGQCVDALDGDLKLREGWKPEMVQELANVWRRWHLNDTRAGTPAQMEHLRANAHKFKGYPQSYYDWARAELASAGLQPDPETGYSYGSAWLYEEVPADVLAFLASLPDATKMHPWSAERS